MRIVVVNTAASSGGALSILRDFYEYIKKNDVKNEWIFLLSDRYIDETDNIKVIVNKYPKTNWINRLKWEAWKGSKFIKNLNPDIVLSMQNTMNRGIKCKKVIYLHQPLPFQKTKKFSFIKKEERFFAIYQYIIGCIIKKSIKNVDKVIVQTNWMKNAILETTCILENNIVVIPPTIPKIQMKLDETYFEKNSFFYPASGVSYKNHRCIVEAVRLLRDRNITNFVVEFTLEDEFRDKLNANNYKNQIKFIGNLDRHEVFYKYRKSILIFPSYIETFGLPLLEARQIGSFILASDTDFANEILDGYDNYRLFDPSKPIELAEYMEKVINRDLDVKDSFRINNCNNYTSQVDTWKVMIDEILAMKKK